MLYQVSHAYKSFGAETVFEDCQFEIKGTEKIALVGRNGCGKTTFLKCICREEEFDRANVALQGDTTIGYLAQKALTNDNETVREALKEVFAPVFKLADEMREMEKRTQICSIGSGSSR